MISRGPVAGARFLALAAFAILLYAGAATFVPQRAVAQASVAPGPEVCQGCHEDHVKSFKASQHGVTGDARSPASNGGCVACHANAGEHVKAGGGKGAGGIVNPGSKTLAADAKNGVCLTCHQKGRVSWQGSKHQANDVACSTCHSVHQAKDKVRDKMTQTQVCFTCHKDKRAEANRASTHPVRSGGIACSSCHNPHGTAGPSLLVKNTVNETCYSCHAEKRGPFLWEHPPASDNCANCHAPHGSNHAPLLKARAPMLCQSCHQTGSGHPNALRSGAGLPATGGGAAALDRLGFPVVGIPASIDNDVFGTDMSIGVDTALNTIVEAIDKLRDTASSHQRAFIVETMGRDCGHLALMSGFISGAEMTLIPEKETDAEEVAAAVRDAYARGKTHAIVVVAEGARLAANALKEMLDRMNTGFESRVAILGHVQRGGSPRAWDRLIAARFGVIAVERLAKGESGVMVRLQAREIIATDLAVVSSRKRETDLEYYRIARMLAK